MDVAQDFFKYMDVLMFVEGTIYHMDEANEDLAQAGVATGDILLPGEAVLLEVLELQGLLDDRIRHELQQGKAYWQLERRICAELKLRSRWEAGGGDPPGFTLSDVIAAHEAKSFDYRVLNLLLYQLRGAEYVKEVLQFLRVDEMLVDIGDDLVDYEDDVEKNSFNIYRGYIHLFGKDAQLQLITRISDLEAQHAKLLAQLPQAIQDKYWQRHRDASSVPGSEKWVFPAPVAAP